MKTETYHDTIGHDYDYDDEPTRLVLRGWSCDRETAARRAETYCESIDYPAGLITTTTDSRGRLVVVVLRGTDETETTSR